MLATVLTFRPEAASGRADSVFEASSARGFAWHDGRLVVAATVSDPPSREERSWFGATESCGERMLVLAPGQALPRAASLRSMAKLELVPGENGGFAIKLRVQSFEGAPVADAPAELLGRVERARSGEWEVAVAGASRGRAKRPLDPAPRASRLLRPLPAGRVEAEFQFDTGGDIMGAPPREAGLVVVVRYADQELRQTIASCPDPSRGNALGDVSGPVLDIAACGDLFRLLSEPGTVRVEREDGRGMRSTVNRIDVPGADRRAVRPAP